MNFRTRINIRPSSWRITYKHQGIAFGSCFAESMTSILSELKYNIICNPFGALYNPISIAQCIKRIANGTPYSESEMIEWQGRWFSTDAHTLLERSDCKNAIETMNSILQKSTDILRSADYVILTLGTDYIYEKDGRTVANCHKLPAEKFTRRRASIEQMTEVLKEVINNELQSKHIILTVSPIRHIKDGLEDCSLSKASLRIVAAQLAQENELVSYFPSYEIMMDELRDYRFYASDMLHPSEVAIEYISTLFKQAWLDPSDEEFNRRITRFVKGCKHRPVDTSSEQYRQFIDSLHRSFEELSKMHPELNWEEEHIFLREAGYIDHSFDKK